MTSEHLPMWKLIRIGCKMQNKGRPSSSGQWLVIDQNIGGDLLLRLFISFQDCSSLSHLRISAPREGFLIFVWRSRMWNCLSLSSNLLMPESHLPIVFPAQLSLLDKWSSPMFQLFDCSIAEPFVQQSSVRPIVIQEVESAHWFKQSTNLVTLLTISFPTCSVELLEEARDDVFKSACLRLWLLLLVQLTGTTRL